MAQMLRLQIPVTEIRDVGDVPARPRYVQEVHCNYLYHLGIGPYELAPTVSDES